MKLLQIELYGKQLLGVEVPIFSITEREQLEFLKNDNVHLQRWIAGSRREIEELRNKIDILRKPVKNMKDFERNISFKMKS